MLALAGYPLGLRCAFFDENAEAPARPPRHADGRKLGRSLGARRFRRHGRSRHVRVRERSRSPQPNGSPRMSRSFPAEGARRGAGPPQGKELFRSLDIDTAEFATVDTRGDLDRAIAAIGLPSVLKTRTQGYDGKGQRVLRRAEDLDPAFARSADRPLLLEGFVPFERELSILAARSRTGETAFWPLVENVHRDGILRLSTPAAPSAEGALTDEARPSPRGRSKRSTTSACWRSSCSSTKVAARQRDGAARPQLGHWTIEGAKTSQFENHLRAVSGLPLGRPARSACRRWST
jgi:5-(carboxyamino)imidazole ribonucleotide synthase